MPCGALTLNRSGYRPYRKQRPRRTSECDVRRGDCGRATKPTSGILGTAAHCHACWATDRYRHHEARAASWTKHRGLVAEPVVASPAAVGRTRAGMLVAFFRDPRSQFAAQWPRLDACCFRASIERLQDEVARWLLPATRRSRRQKRA